MRSSVWASLFLSVACGGETQKPPLQTARAVEAAPPPRAAAIEAEGLSEEQLIPVVESRYPAVRGCHTMQYAGKGDPTAGVITVDLSIAPSGQVVDASVADSTFASDELEACVLDVTRSLRFPRAAGKTEFSWRFRFRAPS